SLEELSPRRPDGADRGQAGLPRPPADLPSPPAPGPGPGGRPPPGCYAGGRVGNRGVTDGPRLRLESRDGPASVHPGMSGGAPRAGGGGMRLVKKLLLYFVLVGVFVVGIVALLQFGSRVAPNAPVQPAAIHAQEAGSGVGFAARLAANLHEPLALLLLQIVV